MTDSPIELYRHGADSINVTGTAWTLYGHPEIESGTEDNYQTEQPGEMTQINSGFTIKPGLNDAIRFDIAGIQNPVTATIHASHDNNATGFPDSYGGTNLATEVQTEMNAAWQGVYGGNPGFTVAWSDTTKKFTIERGGANFRIYWGDAGAGIAGLAETMGFNTVNTGSVTTDTSDNFVFCEETHWLTFDSTGTGGTPTVLCVMVYATNFAAGDQIRLWGSWEYHAGNTTRLNTWAVYKGDLETSIDSGINEMYVWQPDVPAKYWTITIRKQRTTLANAKTKLGVVAFWESAAYSGTRNFSAPWVVRNSPQDQVSLAPLGGGSFRERRRPYYEGSLIFRGWPHSSFLGFERLITRRGQASYLFLLSPDDVQENNAIFGRLMRVESVGQSGPQHTADFDVDILQSPMQALE